MGDILKRAADGGPSAAFRETAFRRCFHSAYIFFEVPHGAGRLFGLVRGLDGRVAIYGEWSRAALVTPADVFVREFGSSNSCIFFEYAAGEGEVATRGGGLALLGGGVSTACQLCNGRLYLRRVAHATLLTHKGPAPTIYRVNRLCRKSCRARFGPNFRVSGAQGLINTISNLPKDGDILVITPSYAIPANYITIYYNRLFRGELSASSESSAVFVNNGNLRRASRWKYAEVLLLALCYFFRLLEKGPA